MCSGASELCSSGEREVGDGIVDDAIGTINQACRSRSEYTEQLISDIANYYGYNEFLAEKLFNLFPVDEVGPA
jgi:hypothetical protein